MNKTKKYLVLVGLVMAIFSCESVDDTAMAPITNPTNLSVPSTTNTGTTTGTTSTTPGGTTGNAGTTSTVNSKNFTLTSDINIKVSLSDYKDNVVVLFFFGSGCTSCKAVSPEIQKTFVDNYANKKVQVIGLDTWDGNLSAVKSFKSSSNLTFPLLLEASGVAKTFETTYDRILVVDKKGEVKFKGTQLSRNDVSNAKKAVDELLAK